MFSEEGLFNKELNFLGTLCPRQYFSVPRCKDQAQCNKNHVQRVYYPCIHYYLGNCKYGMNCKFSHVLVAKVPPASEDNVCFFSLMNGCEAGRDAKVVAGETPPTAQGPATKCGKKHVANIKDLQKYVKFER